MDSTKISALTTAAKVLPGPSDPQWYFAFLLLALLAGVLGTKWIEQRRSRSRPGSGKGDITDTFPIQGKPGDCKAHGERLDRLDTEISELAESTTERLTELERAIQDSLRKQFRDFREEQDRRDQTLRADVGRQLHDSEARMTAAMERMVATIGSMFQQTQDGVRVSGTLRTPQ